MTTSVEKLNELFNTAKTYWVCPVTGTRIDSADAAAIAAHKDKVIKAAVANEKAKALKDGVNKYKETIQKVESLEALRCELMGFVCFITGEVVDFQIAIHRNALQGVYRGVLAVVILDYKNLSAAVRAALAQHFHVVKEGQEFGILVETHSSAYLKDAYFWQNTRLDKREKALAHNLYLAQFEDVVAKKAELKAIVRELHALRVNHATVLGQYNALKEKKLKGFTDIYRK